MEATFANGIPPGVHDLQITITEANRVYKITVPLTIDQDIDDSTILP